MKAFYREDFVKGRNYFVFQYYLIKLKKELLNENEQVDSSTW